MDLFFLSIILFNLSIHLAAQSQCLPYHCLSGCCSSNDQCSSYLNHSALRSCYLGDCDLMTCYSNECCYGGRCFYKSDSTCSANTTDNLLIVVLSVLIPILVLITLVVIIALSSRKKKKKYHITQPIPLNFSYPIVPTYTERRRINQNDLIYNIERPPELYRTDISSTGQITYPNQFSYEEIVIGQIPNEIIKNKEQVESSYLPINRLYLTGNTAHFQEENINNKKQKGDCEGGERN